MSDVLEATTFGLFGLIAGSFLNVFVMRRGEKSLGGRSECPKCGTRIVWYDLVPFFSFVMLGGKCRACGGRISLLYPMGEAITAATFFAIGFSPLSLPLKLYALLIVFFLLAIALYDLKTTYIPDTWVWTFNGLALASVFITFPQEMSALGYALLAGPLTSLPLFAFWYVSKGAWMGFGDVKLALGIGWLLGISSGITALFLAFILGAIVSVVLLLRSSVAIHRLARNHTFLHRVVAPNIQAQYTMKSEIAFGPFLVLACFIVWLLDIYGVETIFTPLRSVMAA